MIEVKNLTKKYGDNLAVNGLSFTVEKGRIYGFLGPNGAGKSTTMNIITGCLAQTSGEVTIDGHDIFEEPVKAKKLIGYLPEMPPLYTDMTPDEYLRFVAAAKGIPPNLISESVESVKIKTGITDVGTRLIKNLSKGYRQRVGIAMAMLGDPEVIILDEPTVGLDPRQIIEIRDLIKTLGENHTVILSSHILSEIQAVCDYVIIISKGQVVASDTLENISHLGEKNPVLHLIVKTELETAMQIADTFEEISHYEITEGENGVDMKLTLSEGADIREQLFFAFADKHIAIIEMSENRQSLEEIYLKLTESTAAPSDTEEDDDENQNDETDDNQNSENEDGEDYKPMFSGEEQDK